jgi:hypothetical protein
MKKCLLLILTALGLLALVPTKSKAQGFGFSVGVALDITGRAINKGGHCDPGYRYYNYRCVYLSPANYPGY